MPFCVHSEMKMLKIHSQQMPNKRFMSLCVLPSVENTGAGETLPGSISLVVVERWLSGVEWREGVCVSTWTTFPADLVNHSVYW